MIPIDFKSDTKSYDFLFYDIHMLRAVNINLLLKQKDCESLRSFLIEEYYINKSFVLFHYCCRKLNSRWSEAEDYIKKENALWEKYNSYFLDRSL